MTNYKNLSGKSGISAYEIGSDYLRVQFTSGKIYNYSYKSAGDQNIESMKTLAKKGERLNRYIKRNVKDKYDK